MEKCDFLFKAVVLAETLWSLPTDRDKDTTLAWNFVKQGYVNVTWTHGCLVRVSPNSPNRTKPSKKSDRSCYKI